MSAENNSTSVDEKKKIPKILVIEDSEADALLIGRRLKDILHGCEILQARTLAAAYEKYLLNKLDLILLDLNLPDGFGARSVEEALSFVRNIPLVVVTGMGSNFTIKEAINVGAHDVIVKSKIMEPEFEQIIKRYIR